VEDRENPTTRWGQPGSEGLDGWFLTTLADGRGSDGRPSHWRVYEHLDGREASVLDDGRCTDPELQALLRARSAREPQDPVPRRGLVASAVFSLARRLVRSWR
jgi:hypothetical protein